MKAVMYGAGNIGRGFIGALLSQAGYRVTFVDVDAALVAALNERGEYPLRIVASEGHTDMTIENVGAVNGSDAERVSEAIAGADIMATAVGANVLRHIAPNIAAGLSRRMQTTDRPLDILICENLMDADKVLGGLVRQHLAPAEQPLFDDRVGLVEASIGRMVPVQTPAMKDGDPLRVCVESYGFLPVDRDAFKGEIPKIEKLVPFAPFGFYLRRKLYIHNMGHAMCAYLGLYTGREYIYQAVDDADIQLLAKNAMLESMEALCGEYGVPAPQVIHHIDDLLHRFTNRALGDTCARVGADTVRKLAPADRLVGAAGFCAQRGVCPVYITLGAAAAVHRHLDEAKMAQTRENAVEVLQNISGLAVEDEMAAMIVDGYERLLGGATPEQLRRAAGRQKWARMQDVI